MPTITLIALMLMPGLAFANVMAPALPLISGIGWVALPLIIAIEALFYQVNSINNPIKLSLYSNVISALIGIIPALLSIPFMLGPSIEKNIKFMYMGAFITALFVLFSWWFSSHVEYRFSKQHRLWRESSISRRLFYKANSITYALISIFLFIKFVRSLSEIPTTT